MPGPFLRSTARSAATTGEALHDASGSVAGVLLGSGHEGTMFILLPGFEEDGTHLGRARRVMVATDSTAS